MICLDREHRLEISLLFWLELNWNGQNIVNFWFPFLAISYKAEELHLVFLNEARKNFGARLQLRIFVIRVLEFNDFKNWSKVHRLEFNCLYCKWSYSYSFYFIYFSLINSVY